MVQVIKQSVTTQTTQGEVTINLNLTITINQDGSIQLSTKQEPLNEKVDYILPDFTQQDLLPDFGEEI